MRKRKKNRSSAINRDFTLILASLRITAYYFNLNISTK